MLGVGGGFLIVPAFRQFSELTMRASAANVPRRRRAFGVSELIAVELARGPDGWITGDILGVPSAREGKVTRVQQWLAQRGLAWDTVHSTFYSDSINDLPLLEKVNEPVATNPDARLRAIALERGWRTLNLFE